MDTVRNASEKKGTEQRRLRSEVDSIEVERRSCTTTGFAKHRSGKAGQDVAWAKRSVERCWQGEAGPRHAVEKLGEDKK